MNDADQKAPIERALELVVYAPIGFALFAKDMLPPLVQQFVTRGRQEVEDLTEKVEHQLGQARIIGQFAVSQGGEQIRRGVRSRVGEARERGEEVARTVGFGPSAEEPPPARTEAAPAATTPSATTGGNGSRGDSSHLPIPDYDELSASQVVARLAGLSDIELAAVREYETSHRQRKTVLTRIDQLAS